MQREQSGFTLIEIAIVMGIIGLFLTLTVKGREMVEHSHCDDLAKNFTTIAQALYDLQVRANTSQGVAPKANKIKTPNKAFADIPQKDSDIADLLNASLNEPFYIWQHVQPPGLLPGISNTRLNSYVPLNTSGGNPGVTAISNAPIHGMSSNYIICSDNISGRLVKQLDMMLDDGYTGKGAMLVSHANGGGEAIPSDNINERDYYLACLSV